jgi:hypothetical protein
MYPETVLWGHLTSSYLFTIREHYIVYAARCSSVVPENSYLLKGLTFSSCPVSLGEYHVADQAPRGVERWLPTIPPFC